ncbi:MAG TPA: ACT domain-containing protein [Candidatus Polarisedimenticolia bacterium]
MTGPALTLSVLPGRFAISRLDPEAEVPAWATGGAFFSVTRTAGELSIVCPEEMVPAGVRCASDWSALRLEGTFDFGVTGILSSLAAPLAKAGISIFALSTFDTDYLLVRHPQLEQALAVLAARGHHLKR